MVLDCIYNKLWNFSGGRSVYERVCGNGVLLQERHEGKDEEMARRKHAQLAQKHEQAVRTNFRTETGTQTGTHLGTGARTHLKTGTGTGTKPRSREGWFRKQGQDGCLRVSNASSSVCVYAVSYTHLRAHETA